MTATMHTFPTPDLLLGQIEDRLAEARQIGRMVSRGEPVRLSAMAVAREVLERHGDEADAAMILQLECAAMLRRMHDRKPPDTALDVFLRNRRKWWQLVIAAAVGVAFGIFLMGVN